MLNLPIELINYIYEFDPTHKNYFNICLLELLDEHSKISFFWKKGYRFRQTYRDGHLVKYLLKISY